MRTAAVTTLGCKTNRFESNALEERLAAAGYRLVPFDDGADLMVVNTCTVTAATDAQSRNLIRRARRINPECRVVVTGCYAQVNPAELAALPGVSVVLGNEEKQAFIDHLEDSQEQVIVGDIRRVAAAATLPISSFADRSRAFVQIQNGCDAFCSYCIIPYARGASRSVAPDAVIRQIEELVTGGYPEIVLTGIHIGGYGLDLSPRLSLAELLRRILAETKVQRLRLGSIEPTELSRELIDLVATHDVICPHFHIPLQSGDDQVLRRMNRHYDRRFFRELVETIATRVPDVAIGLDVIAGFPAETAAEHRNTRALIDALPISHLHVFPFSRRSGTPAADMDGQLPTDLRKERARELRELGERKLADYAQAFVGRSLEVVIENGLPRKGLTRNYLTVQVDAAEELVGRAAPVRIERCHAGTLYGRLA